VPFDETWDFVGKKERNREPDETTAGDCWDHVALDPESRLVVSLVVGKRTAEATHELVGDFHRRTGGRIPRLITSDEYPVYADAIRVAYGREVTPPRTGKPGRPRNPCVVLPPAVTYATVHKHKENGRVVRVSETLVFGTWFAVLVALALSRVSRVVNTSFVERHNGTDRGRCSRKGRKSYEFSKSWEVHVAATRFSYFSYNFCWCVRTLRVKGDDGKWRARTPAMAAGLTDHVWSIAEWLAFPGVQRK
jgi:IS1 family transposase